MDILESERVGCKNALIVALAQADDLAGAALFLCARAGLEEAMAVLATLARFALIKIDRHRFSGVMA